MRIRIVTAEENEIRYPTTPSVWTDDLCIEHDEQTPFITLEELARALKPHLDKLMETK